VVDHLFDRRDNSKLLLDDVGRISYWSVIDQITIGYLLIIRTGSLFLGVFSGPVEGIIIIVAMFAITGIKGAWAHTCAFA
jgi:hypothetical protein